MASLQDQLLKAGLTDSNKVKKAHSTKHKQSKAARKSGQKTVSESTINAERKQAQQAERDRALNLKRQEQQREKEIAAQVVQMIDTNKIEHGDGDLAYSFVDDKKVKNIYVGEREKNLIISGSLSIVGYADTHHYKYEIVPSVVARKIRERNPKSVINIQKEDSIPTLEDDPYADYVIPNDLDW